MSYPFDYSTINADELRKLPEHRLPKGYRYQDGVGSACYGDAPGFPSYFTQHVYTRHGDSPNKGASMVLIVPGEPARVIESTDFHGKTWDDHRQHIMARLRRLWSPLPIDHPRVVAWMRATYQHCRNCYIDDSKPFGDNDRIVIYPTPYYKLRCFFDDERFSDAWREKERAAVAQENAETEARYAAIATHDNHLAVRNIRKFYPDHAPDLAMIATPPNGRFPDWWERYAEQPSAADCCGLGGTHPHPVGSPCQTCGRE